LKFTNAEVEATSEEAGRNTKRLQKQRKIQFLLRKEYEKLNNRRKDAQNKVLAFLKIYRKVVFQDDCVKGWSGFSAGRSTPRG